ncbi:uncharacterized protein Z519_11202 [Cladophialophora bantiana CBS 173.52]|uniref:Metallo-beta-lactamase domain-containing protein n=1 Tax=Cladophialophora bantiana (strain ATCC 10958 / CBS 173.52 / CDC B-1940 / NIH 8579) TaxID=1442370 RepID=A0A0D2FN08_CLAB1|nr:uncharacterized protein Z519_11202 [Cladophialophora bantiana CBS 173.52]KIW88092.1 hypothetical protein Z519_11202 [Cladophialophora bantiana CBS 173.52]
MASSYTIHPAKAAPTLKIPKGASATVSIIDTTSRIQAPVGLFMHPAIPGHEHLNAPAFSFLIEQQKSGRKILFDLGLRKDWQSHPPAVLKLISGPGWAMEIQKECGRYFAGKWVDRRRGSKGASFPAYPHNGESPLLESDFVGREYQEIDFDKGPTHKVGNYRGIDYFGDGSFYILDAPGHAIGHVVGLARVTSTQDGDPEDTFVLMGADTAHHGGEFRPTEYLPIPKDITPSPYVAKYASTCPGHIFESIHPRKKAVDPFYHLHDEVPHNKQQADHSCGLMQEFDAADNVFVIIAHDATLLDPRVGIEWFPHGTLKNWKVKDSDNKARWLFLQDVTQALE